MRATTILFTAILFVLQASGKEPTRQEEPPSKFERFIFTKGQLRIVEHFSVGGIEHAKVGGGVGFRVSRAFDPVTKEYSVGLRVHVVDPPKSNRIGFLDADEVLSFASALS